MIYAEKLTVKIEETSPVFTPPLELCYLIQEMIKKYDRKAVEKAIKIGLMTDEELLEEAKKNINYIGIMPEKEI